MRDENDKLTETLREASKKRFLDELMAHIIVAGGVRMDHERLKAHRLGELLDLIWPNAIRLKVETVRDELQDPMTY